MNRFLVILFLLAMGCGFSLSAQNIKYKEGPQIGEMMEKYIELNRATTSIPGWRIQILATTDRQKLENVRQTFQYRYPNVPVDWIHSTPYYKLRAGAYATKLEATRMKYILSRDYAGIYLVKDDKIPVELVVEY